MYFDRGPWLARFNGMTFEELKRKAEELIERRGSGVRFAVTEEDDLDIRARRAWEAIHEDGRPGPGAGPSVGAA
jgi:hypothetical protein